MAFPPFIRHSVAFLRAVIALRTFGSAEDTLLRLFFCVHHAVDLKVYDALKDLKWTPGDTRLYAAHTLG